MLTHTPTRILLALLAMAGSLTMVAPSAGADDVETHCSAEVIGQEESGEYVLSEPECFTTYSRAMSSLGLGSGLKTPAKAQAAAASLQMVLASHFDGANYTGSSFSVSGADCSGGYINMSASWDNVVSSTFSWNCPRVRHWTSANLGGSFQDTVPSGNLSSPVNNAVSSIQYLT